MLSGKRPHRATEGWQADDRHRAAAECSRAPIDAVMQLTMVFKVHASGIFAERNALLHLGYLSCLLAGRLQKLKIKLPSMTNVSET